MNFWVAAFVGADAGENYETTTATGNFWVSSTRTPIRRAAPSDRTLLYISREGFVGEATVLSPARTPYGEVSWAGHPPQYGLSLGGIKLFETPIPYKFPGSGSHPVLGFHRYSLTGGFLSVSEEGFHDVLGWAGRETEDLRECRAAGEHASKEGRKRAALWTVAEAGAAAIGWKGAEKRARDGAWKAEEKVGAELEALRRHGFYLFHDVSLKGLGNVDHVALGPRGFFGIETKSHKGQVSVRRGELLLNGRPPQGNFVSQAWKGCYRLKEVLAVEEGF